MFNFTTTTIINSNVNSANPKLKAFEVKEVEGKKVLFVNGQRFHEDNISAVYKAEATEAKLAKSKITLPSDLAAGLYRVDFYIQANDQVNAFYANAYEFKGKPFSLEFEVKKDNEDPAEVAKRVVKTAKKLFAGGFEEKVLDITAEGAALVLEALDESARFRTLELKKLVNPGCECNLGTMSEYKTIDPEAEVVCEAVPSFGTYNWITRNLRLPTDLNTSVFGLVQDERPIPGALYNQYTLHYCVDRGVMGDAAVGEVVKSKTVHVFYVKQDLASDFEAAVPGTEIKVPNK